MKKYIIPTIIFFALALGTVITILTLSYQKVQYLKDLSIHMTSLEEGGNLVAEYSDQKINVLGQNIGAVYKALSVSERRKIILTPDYNSATAITLSFPSGAQYYVVVNEDVDDGVYIHYTYQNYKTWISIQKYRTYDRISSAVAPDGTYNENEIVE